MLDLMKMKHFEMHAAEMQASVGPGLKKSEFNALLEPHGFLFGPDPASNPSVGGMASTRGSGLSTVMYGTTAENVVSLRVVTPEGKLITTRRRVRKSATGYALTQVRSTMAVPAQVVWQLSQYVLISASVVSPSSSLLAARAHLVSLFS